MGDVLVRINRPQEVLFALQLLKESFDNYFTTAAEYNRAQFELFHALGYPAREIIYVNFPGTVEPVDTTRPAYLPPDGRASASNSLKPDKSPHPDCHAYSSRSDRDRGQGRSCAGRAASDS
jgi:hypothetical protein